MRRMRSRNDGRPHEPPPPNHHSPRFQPTQVTSARLSATAEPNRRAATCSTATAMPNPTRPQPPLAITAAVGGPPMRGCRISIMLVNTTGNSASVPLTYGPTQPDNVTTVATRVATSERAQRDIVPAARDQRHLDVAEAPQQRQADRERNRIGEQAAGERPVNRSRPASPARARPRPRRRNSPATLRRCASTT